MGGWSVIEGSHVPYLEAASSGVGVLPWPRRNGFSAGLSFT